jgi:putative transposase
MDNHYHLLVEIQEAGLAAGMQWLNGVYAQSFNRAGGRSGHLFQGRYHAALVQHEGHLLETARYIVLNPVRAQLCAEPRDWPWSSYRATAGEERPHPALTAGWLIEGFGGSSLASRTARYRSFIASGIRAT